MSLFPFFVQPLGFLNFWFIPTLLSLLAFVVQVGFGWGIYKDGLLRRTAFVPAWIWGVAAGIGGFLVVGLYWLMHHSNLSRVEGGRAVESDSI